MKAGAYGLRLSGDAPRSELLTRVFDGSPVIELTRQIGEIEVPNVVDESQATVPLINGGGITLSRADRSAA